MLGSTELAIVVPRRSWFEISLWKLGNAGRQKKEKRKKGKKEKRKKGKKEERKKGRKEERKKGRKRDGIQTAELDSRDQVTATNSWLSSFERGTEVDYQVAAPTESSTPNWHRARIAHQRVRMEGWRQRRLGSMGTIWKKKKQRRRKKK